MNIAVKNRNFIFTGLQPWHIRIGSNAKNIATEISRHNRVLYINTPLDYKTYLKKDTEPENVYRRDVIDRKKPFLNKINENLYILDIPFAIFPVNTFPDGAIFDFFNRVNNRRIYSFVNKIKHQLGFDNHILFIDNDIYRSRYASEFLESCFTIYYRRDNLRSRYWAKHAPRLEKHICVKSDIVLTNSAELSEFPAEFCPSTFCVGQGVDLTDYSEEKKYGIPEDMKQLISKPIIGYSGFLTSKRLDTDLIQNLANHFKEFNFVFVGPEDEVFSNHKIRNTENIFFLGTKDSSEIPAYISYFDICMNPQVVNEITQGNYPRKVDEYLSLGKPVVATNTSAMKLFEDYCYNCTDYDEYKKAIKDIHEHNLYNYRKKEKIEFARSHSWEKCVELIYKHISENLK